MKGLILAAGEGTRIRNATYDAFPKEPLPIGNDPTIHFSMESLRFGVKVTYCAMNISSTLLGVNF